MLSIMENLISCREDSDDYRFCLSMAEIKEIDEALKHRDLVEEIKRLMEETDDRR